MPLRLVVQALFFQQLNTHQAFKDCSDSFRLKNSTGFSVSVVPSSICPNSRPLTSQESPCTDDEVAGSRSRPLCFLMQRDATLDDYESTSFRIQNLQEQLISLKESLKKPTCPGKRSASKNRNPFGQVTTSCIGSVSFTFRREYANRLLRVLRRVTLFGSRKPNRKVGTES